MAVGPPPQGEGVEGPLSSNLGGHRGVWKDAECKGPCAGPGMLQVLKDCMCLLSLLSPLGTALGSWTEAAVSPASFLLSQTLCEQSL